MGVSGFNLEVMMKDLFRFDNSSSRFQVKKVIFNPPATIVCWKDGTKTVVKTMKGEKYDTLIGMALCYIKKLDGGSCNNFYKELKKAEELSETNLKKLKKEECAVKSIVSDKDIDELNNKVKELRENIRERV